MNSSEFIKQVMDDMFRHNLVVIRTDVEQNDIEYIVGCYVYDLLMAYLDTIKDYYLSDNKLTLLKHKISECNVQLKMLLDPTNLFLIWRDVDKILDQWEKKAIYYELYEGVVNLQKLRDMI